MKKIDRVNLMQLLIHLFLSREHFEPVLVNGNSKGMHSQSFHFVYY